MIIKTLAMALVAAGVLAVADAEAASINLRADVHGTSITFSWNNVSRADTVTYYALVLESRGTEIQVDADTLEHVAGMYGDPGDRLTWLIEARDSGRTAGDGGTFVVARDTVAITVPTNRAPNANAGSDRTVQSFADMVQLDGSRSSDRNGDYLSYEWTTANDTSIQNRFDARPTLDILPAATDGSLTFVFTLTVSDGEFTDSDAVRVIVASSRPEADAGADFAVRVNDTATLDASGSTDADGSQLAYLWEQTSGTDVDFTNDTARTVFEAPASPTTLRFKLTVSDGTHRDTDFISVRVVDSSPPMAHITPPATPSVGQRVMLDGSASTDPDGDRLSYRWTQTGGDAVSLSGSRSAVASFTATAAHVDVPMEFTLVVSDGAFESQTSVGIIIEENRPPHAYIGGSITKPPGVALLYGGKQGADYTLPQGVTFQLDGSDSIDPNNDRLTYSWVQDEGQRVGLSGSRTATPSFNTHSIMRADLIVFNLTVRDVVGHTDTAQVKILVEGYERIGADAGPDRVAVPGAKVSLDGSDSFGYYGGVGYSWTQESGPSVSLRDKSTAFPYFTAPNNVNQTLVFRLTVSDGDLRDSDTVSVLIGEAESRTVADAGNNQRVAGGANVTLSGGGTSADGDLSYRWQQTGGPRVSLANATTQEPSFTAPDTTRLATLTFRLTVTDEAGGSDSDTVSVIVGSNGPPSVDAGDNIRAVEGTTVRLSGSGSDPERDRLSYSWSHTHDNLGIDLRNPNSNRPYFVAPAVSGYNTFTFTLTVFDTTGNSASDSVEVLVVDAETHTQRVSQMERTVTANAGPNQRALVNSTVQLDGSDSVGRNLEYQWSKRSGPSVTLSNSTVASPTFTTPTSPGTLTFRLTVTSGNIADSDTVTIMVVSESNRAPSADAGGDREVSPGTVVRLSGSGSDPDGDDLTYGWVQTSGTSVEFDGDNREIEFAAPERAGTLAFRLTVTDINGNAGRDTVNVVVSSARPVADAGTNIVAEPGTTVRLDGRGSHIPDGGSLTYRWVQTDGQDVSLSGSSGSVPSFRAPQVADERFVFMLTVSDRNGNTDTDTVEVRVQSIRPIANAGSDTRVKPGERVYLDGYSSGPGSGSVSSVSYEWVQTSGTAVELNGANSLAPWFEAPDINGALSFRLTVSNGILSDSDTVRITVDRNDPPRVDAGSGKTLRAGATGTLSGSASDPDGDRLTYLWDGSGLVIHDKGSLRTTFTAPMVDETTTFNVTLTAGDGTNSTSDTVKITVKRNVEPSASIAGGQQHVPSGQRVTLDGSGSSDPDGDRLTYSWTYERGDADPAISISNSKSSRASFTAPSGTHYSLILLLTVSDGIYSDSAYVIVGVSDNQKPSVDAGSDRSASSNSTITLTGTLRDSDGDAIVHWEQVSGPSVNYQPANDAYTSVTVETPVVESGSVQLVFRMVAVDSAWYASDTVTITVR